MLCMCCRYWSELHVPGTPAPFKLRGASYLADRTKVDGGMPQFVLGSVDLVETAGPTQHISRFLPAVRCVMVLSCCCVPGRACAKHPCGAGSSVRPPSCACCEVSEQDIYSA